MALEQLRKQIAERTNTLSVSGYVPASSPTLTINLTQSLNLPIQRQQEKPTTPTSKEEPANSALEKLRQQIAIRTSNGIARPQTAPSSLESQQVAPPQEKSAQSSKPIPPPKPDLASSNSRTTSQVLAENSSEDTGRVITQLSFNGESISVVVPRKPHANLNVSSSSSSGYSSEDNEEFIQEEEEEDRPLRSSQPSQPTTKHLPSLALFSPTKEARKEETKTSEIPKNDEKSASKSETVNSSSFAFQTKVRLLETEANLLKEQLAQSKQGQESLQKQIELLEKDDTKQNLLQQIQELQMKLEERNKERQQYKEMMQSIHEAEMKKQSNITEVIKEMEQRMESQQKKLEMAEEEISKRSNVEESLRRELEKLQHKLYEDTEDSHSTMEMLHKNLQMEAEKLRKRLEVALKEKEAAETQNAVLTQCYEDTKQQLEIADKAKGTLEREKVELSIKLEAAKSDAASEQKEKKELEQLNTALKDYKLKYHKEWEEKLSLESNYRSLERQFTLLKKKVEMNRHLELDDSELLHSCKGMSPASSPRIQQEISGTEELQRTKKEVETLKEQLSTQKHLREAAEMQLKEVSKKKQDLQKSLKELTEESSLEGQLLKLRREHASVVEELNNMKEKLKLETRKKNEILLAKVKTDKSFQTLKGRLEKSEGKVASAPSTPFSSPQVTRRLSKSPSMRSEASAEDVQDLLNRLEEQSLMNVSLERENALLRERGFHHESEVRTRLKLEDSCRILEAELEKANSLIQFQHQELTTKHKELEESRENVISMLMSSQKNALKRQ